MTVNKKMKIGIYKITNVINNKCYIGSSVNIKRRLQYHRRLLISNNHWNSHFQNAWNKYNEENFKFEILLYCNKESLVFYEQLVINFYDSANNSGYNISPIAGNQLGFKFSDSSRLKMSSIRRGRVLSKEWKENVSKSLIGHSVSTETREKISQKLTGRILSDEYKESLKGRKSPMLGRKHSDETKLLMSESQKGKKISLEVRKKISKANAGRIPWNKGKTNIKRKISESKKGKLFSEEHKNNLSISHIGNKHSKGIYL